MNTIELLASYNLAGVGEWKLSDSYSSTPHLKHLPGIEFQLLPEFANRRNVVYAFVVNDNVVYIGETTKGMKERFVGYRYGNTLKRDIDNRVKEYITNALQRHDKVVIWAATPETEHTLLNGKHTIPVSKPIEESLIAILRPQLNKKNIGLPTTADLANYPQKTPGDDLAITTKENQMSVTSKRTIAVRLVHHELVRMGYTIMPVGTANADITAEYNNKKYAISVRFRHFPRNSTESEMDVIKNNDITKVTDAAVVSQMIPMLAYVANLSNRASTHLFLTSFEHIQTDPVRFKKVKHGFSLYFSEKKIGQYTDDPMLTYRCWHDDNLERLCEPTIDFPVTPPASPSPDTPSSH